VRILIDTHYVLWTALNPSEMSPWAHRLLADLKNEILVSSASIYEISLKVRLGKLPEAAEFEGDLLANIEEKLGFVLLPLDPQSMYRFDRMIAAQAFQYDLPLLSVDPKMDAFGMRRVKRPVSLP
jgi:PIN domain nuclease of toxin-antitoxin system